MLTPLEPLFCPCCAPVVLHALSQYGSQFLTQPLLLLGSGSLSAALGLKNPSLVITPADTSLLLDRSTRLWEE